MLDSFKARNIPPITRIAISLSNTISLTRRNQFDIDEINLNLIRAEKNWIKNLSVYQHDLEYLKSLFLENTKTLLHLRQIRTKLTRYESSYFEVQGLLKVSTMLTQILGSINARIDLVQYDELQRLKRINEEVEKELENIKVSTSWNSLMILTSHLPNAIKLSQEDEINTLLNKYSHPFSLQKIEIETIDNFFKERGGDYEKKVRILTAYSSGPLIAGIIAQYLKLIGFSVDLEIVALYSNTYSNEDINFPILSSQIKNKPRFEGFSLIIDDQFQSFETAEALQRYARLTSTII